MSNNNDDKRRVSITTVEAGMIAEASLAAARQRLGIPDNIEIARGQWVDAMPDIKRGLELSAKAPGRRRKVAVLKTTDGPDYRGADEAPQQIAEEIDRKTLAAGEGRE